MKKAIETVKEVRTALINMISELSIEQLNEVPPNFNNNIIWNMAHMTAAQQGLCYTRSGLEAMVDEHFLSSYKPGTKPGEPVGKNEVEQIKSLLISTIEKLNIDYERNLFTTYPTFTTRYGVQLSSIDDAIDFLPFHDGLHIGYIMALKKLVSH